MYQSKRLTLVQRDALQQALKRENDVFGGGEGPLDLLDDAVYICIVAPQRGGVEAVFYDRTGGVKVAEYNIRDDGQVFNAETEQMV